MNNIKYLDREICSNMKWNEKINLITQKIIKKKWFIGIMKEFRDILNKKDLRFVYLALMEPIISYQIIVSEVPIITFSLDYLLVKIH